MAVRRNISQKDLLAEDKKTPAEKAANEENRSIPDDVILTACEIACFHSQAQTGTKTVCDYTFRRNLKRHPSGKPGMVLYTVYNSATVVADEHKEYLQKD